MSLNANWPRWIFASMSNHFVPKFSPLPVFIEGKQRGDTSNTDLVEFRMDGPYLKELSKDVWHAYVEVNILVQCMMRSDDIHIIHKNVGIVAAAFDNQIAILRYGDSVGDDKGQIGCMKLAKDARGRPPIQISHFGQIDPNIQLMQATVEGHYEMILEI